MNATSCSLAMYDLPGLRPQVRTLWLGIARHLRSNGIEAPGEPDWPADLASHWRDPALLLAQSCGYPLLGLPRRVRVVATPEYAAPGCEGASYRSALVVRADRTAAALATLRGGVCAINGRDSNSGMNLLRAEVAVVANGERFFREVVETGSHLASMEA
ncbi:MAG: PhnD/SsuA/transferrin family substrate-binding protein, partial [Gluconacetobacter diazotrophicus]|nr:PhnD/SsuA/transferrin family substrate-binding protein [Gluconacetobacter diazotrophicus]